MPGRTTRLYKALREAQLKSNCGSLERLESTTLEERKESRDDYNEWRRQRYHKRAQLLKDFESGKVVNPDSATWQQITAIKKDKDRRAAANKSDRKKARAKQHNKENNDKLKTRQAQYRAENKEKIRDARKAAGSKYLDKYKQDDEWVEKGNERQGNDRRLSLLPSEPLRPESSANLIPPLQSCAQLHVKRRESNQKSKERNKNKKA